MKALEAFYHHIARSITGKTDWIIIERGWEPPPKEEAIEAVELWLVR